MTMGPETAPQWNTVSKRVLSMSARTAAPSRTSSAVMPPGSGLPPGDIRRDDVDLLLLERGQECGAEKAVGAGHQDGAEGTLRNAHAAKR